MSNKICPNTILSFKFHACTFFIDTETVIDDQMLDKNISNETGKRVFEKQVFGNKKVDLMLF